MFDESKGIAPRFTFEELLLPDEELFWLAKEKDDKLLNEMMGKMKTNFIKKHKNL